jgi:hypothetical protein
LTTSRELNMRPGPHAYEQLDADKLAGLTPFVPLPWVQRLGYLLEHIDHAPTAQPLKAPLKAFVRAHARDMTLLQPSTRDDAYPRNAEWKLIVNAE